MPRRKIRRDSPKRRCVPKFRASWFSFRMVGQIRQINNQRDTVDAPSLPRSKSHRRNSILAQTLCRPLFRALCQPALCLEILSSKNYLIFAALFANARRNIIVAQLLCRARSPFRLNEKTLLSTEGRRLARRGAAFRSPETLRMCTQLRRINNQGGTADVARGLIGSP